MNLAESSLGFNILWKVKIVSDKIVYLSGEISKQSVEGSAYLLLTTYNKMSEEKKKLNIYLLSRNKVELKDLKNFQPIHIARNEKAKNEKAYSEGKISVCLATQHVSVAISTAAKLHS